MARKNPFENLINSDPDHIDSAEVKYVAKGASRSIINTIDDLADKADRLMEGETIVELDPDEIDPSFIKDRLDYDNEDFEKLVKALSEEGQNTPILVRPNPNNSSRYMVVFGARRCKAAARLGIKVRAVIKNLSDRDHAVAQGQENAARANLSFIERASLASNLVQQNFDEDNSTVLSALSIDKSTLSKMLSVSSISSIVLDAIGSAKSIGRDRWYELKLLLENPKNEKKALELLSQGAFADRKSDERFDQLYAALKGRKKVSKSIVHKSKEWVAEDRHFTAKIGPKGKSYAISINAKNGDATKFGDFLSDNFDLLYKNFKNNTKINQEN